MTTAATPSVGLVGWRGMVGSVLMQRMQDEGDFASINPVFFSTSNAGGAAPAFAEGCRQARGRVRRRDPRQAADHRDRPGRRLHQAGPRRAAQPRLGRSLDRCRLHAADERRFDHRAGPDQPRRHRQGPRQRHQGFHRRQLHRLLHADGPRRAVQERPRRVGHLHDLPGCLRRRRPAYARTAEPVRHAQRPGQLGTGRPGVGHPGHRPQGPGPPAHRHRRHRSSASRWPAR